MPHSTALVNTACYAQRSLKSLLPAVFDTSTQATCSRVCTHTSLSLLACLAARVRTVRRRVSDCHCCLHDVMGFRACVCVTLASTWLSRCCRLVFILIRLTNQPVARPSLPSFIARYCWRAESGYRYLVISLQGPTANVDGLVANKLCWRPGKLGRWPCVTS